MKTADFSISRGLAIILALALAVQAPFAQAEIVDTPALAAPSQAELDRAKVQSFLERANVKERLQAMGVSGLVAADRVDSLNEAEVHALAQRIDSMPAGGALGQQEWIIILLLVILLIVAI